MAVFRKIANTSHSISERVCASPMESRSRRKMSCLRRASSFRAIVRSAIARAEIRSSTSMRRATLSSRSPRIDRTRGRRLERGDRARVGRARGPHGRHGPQSTIEHDLRRTRASGRGLGLESAVSLRDAYAPKNDRVASARSSKLPGETFIGRPPKRSSVFRSSRIRTSAASKL